MGGGEVRGKTKSKMKCKKSERACLWKEKSRADRKMAKGTGRI